MKKLLFLTLLGLSSIQIFSAAGGGGAAGGGAAALNLKKASDEELAETINFFEIMEREQKKNIRTIEAQLSELRAELSKTQTQLAAAQDEQQRRSFDRRESERRQTEPASQRPALSGYQMRIPIRSVLNNTTYWIEIGLDNSVTDMINILKAENPELADKDFKLIINGKFMEYFKPLADYGVNAASIIHLV